MPKISAIVPTRNRAAFLGRCLASLCEQTLSSEEYEICVVNNCGSDNSPEIVASVVAQNPNHTIRMIDEPVIGLSSARNAGIRAANAPLVAFTDDDATVPADWLARYIEKFHHLDKTIVAVGGDIIPVWGSGERPSWLTDLMAVMLSAYTGLGDKERVILPHEAFFEGNSCYRRDALLEVGLFPTSLGRIGNNLLSGDNNVTVLMQKRGGVLYYDPEIKIYHYIHNERLNASWLRRRFFWHGITDFAARQYFIKNDIPVVNELPINLPLDSDDWQFLNQEIASGLQENFVKFRALGFMLSITDIISMEGI